MRSAFQAIKNNLSCEEIVSTVEHPFTMVFHLLTQVKQMKQSVKQQRNNHYGI
jgi:hypothetical protein